MQLLRETSIMMWWERVCSMCRDLRRRFLLGMSHMTQKFLGSFPDVPTSASGDLQNDSCVATACAAGRLINTFPQVCLNIYRHGHMMNVILAALHRTLPDLLFLCFKYRDMVAWVAAGVISAFILAWERQVVRPPLNDLGIKWLLMEGACRELQGHFLLNTSLFALFGCIWTIAFCLAGTYSKTDYSALIAGCTWSNLTFLKWFAQGDKVYCSFCSSSCLQNQNT